MNRKLLLQVTAPVVLIGLVLFGSCLASARYINRMQTNLANLLAMHVTSMQAAQQLEIIAHQLRFRCFLYTLAPDTQLAREIERDQQLFEQWLVRAEKTALTPHEINLVRGIKDGYRHYAQEFARRQGHPPPVLKEGVLVSHPPSPKREKVGTRHDYRQLADLNPIRHVTEPCREYLRVNEEQLALGAKESSLLSQRLHLALLLLGLGGPLGGLLSGYGIARGLSRSISRLSVQVRDVVRQLDQDVAAVELHAAGDLQSLDLQLQQVVRGVGEVVQRVQEQQQQVLRAQQLGAVGQLAASVAHEVRNPLTSIKMLVEAALRPTNPRPLTTGSLRVVHGEVLRLEQTVQGFLDFARPPALQRRPSDLRNAVAQAVSLIQTRARQQKVHVKVESPDNPLFGDVDSGQICTVLVNLFINALDAMPQGGRLEARLEAAFPGKVSLSVADSGPGISSPVLERLFTPFLSTKATGSGLGLSICKRIIEEHGGSLTAANLPEGGARFVITLPATEADHADPARD